MKFLSSALSRLAFRHLLVVVLVTVLFSAGLLLYEVRLQYTRGAEAMNDVLEMIETSYLPPVAAGVFFFDDYQLQLLAEGMSLLPYVESVMILERRSGTDSVILSTDPGVAGAQNGDTREYPLLYEYDGTEREIGTLQVTTSMQQLSGQIAEQIRITTVANLLKILAFALVILVVVQRMVFRHLRSITTFVLGLDPNELAGRELVLARGNRVDRTPDELDEISGAINMMLGRLGRTVKDKEALLQELYHRTGNMMQSVRAILRLQSSRNQENEPLQAIVRAVDNRILAIALVHQKLYHGGNLSRIDMKEYLEQLAQEIRLSQHRPNLQIELQTDIEELSMLIDTAIPCGMILCELLSNSLQHAFPKGRSGMIRVALSRTSDELYLLTVADDGIGVGSSFDPRRDGALGIQSVTAIVETQLRGQVELEGTSGVRWRILFSDNIYKARVPNE